MPRPKMARSVLAVLAALCLGGPPALARPPSPGAALEAIPAPDQSKAVPLRGPRRGTAGHGAEQWGLLHGERIVRNVTAPTLTPFLPDPAKATGAAVIVAPGGAFLFLSIDNEGDAVARWLAGHGIAAFVLKYRTEPTPRDPQGFFTALAGIMDPARGEQIKHEATPEALADAEAAVRLVRARAKSWKIDPHRVGVVGFSAGAMTTLAVGLTPDKAARPDFIAPIYGPMGPLAVPPDAPPIFVAVALDDPLMAKGKSLGLIDSWRHAGRPIEAHLYERGGHGFGMSAHSPAAALWPEEFYAWMQEMGLLAPAR